ncbi:LysR substrate-binding domain-containing protein [Actinacidiphila sp. bgisy160]|uniref:LysR substrate-binding domain-containing protein n=1 Tax=Actinacidiphila sp. bgisy160 TaxID=3413796 RepID=UPI003D7452C8
MARGPRVSLVDLSGQDLVVFPRAEAPGWSDRLLETCRAAGFVPGGVRHASSPEFPLVLVAAGGGVAPRGRPGWPIARAPDKLGVRKPVNGPR